MDVIFSAVKRQHVLVYIDDIIIFARTLRHHIKHDESILPLIRAARMTLKLKKCYFISDLIDFLGHVITLGCLPAATYT